MFFRAAVRRSILAAIVWCCLAGAVLAAQRDPATILVFGDSLSASYGLASGQGWADLLQGKLAAERLPFRVANASISGETTAGGKTRIDAALKRFEPAIVVLELGANDGLRGGSIQLMQSNLDYMIEHIKAHGARVVLVGMRLPSNYGPAYTRQFFDVFHSLARKHKTAYVPFLFEGLRDDDEAFQPDRLHPTARSQQVLLANVWQGLQPLLKARS